MQSFALSKGSITFLLHERKKEIIARKKKYFIGENLKIEANLHLPLSGFAN